VEAVPSPCNGICTLGRQDICLGCGRTIEEIAEWPLASEPRKLTIAEAALTRMKAKLAQPLGEKPL